MSFNKKDLDEIMDRNELYEQYWINHNEKKSMYDSISNVTYVNKVIPWEKNKLNYCVIRRVKLDNSSENVVVLRGCDSIVHEVCIKRYFTEKKKKINCPICDSKGFTNMIELKTINNIYLKRICIPVRLKLKKLQIILYYYNKIVSKTNEKITFHVFYQSLCLFNFLSCF
jgi:hypothetical protein